ncbi:hypothetical protein, partial [Salmonella sp. s39606]|uniref:hypothetical protein n=1 Tax=Salmonella sp. s39606 TaxID=3159643 RepID=UPI00398047C7
LDLPGTTIEEVQVDPLETFFEYFDVDLLNALDDTEELPDVSIHARVRRLNHKPFVFSVKVNSDAERLVTVRVFLGPKYDWFGQEIPINDKRHYIVEIDKFVAKVNAGKTVITRKSSESSVTIPDRETTKVLTQKVEDAIAGKAQLTVNKDVRHCGYPDRLLLPKGKQGGMPYLLYVTVTDYQKDVVDAKVTPDDIESLTSLSYCGVLEGKIPDRRPLGFPFDRRIESVDEFLTPNS